MRAMTEAESHELIRRANWATICTVDANGTPYAIEATPFYTESTTCFMINPRGGVWKNLQTNKNVLLKYTLTSPSLDFWAGVSALGTGEFVTDSGLIRDGWALLGKVMGADYSKAAETFSRLQGRTPLFSVTVMSLTGRCNAGKSKPLVFPSEVRGECCYS